MFNTQNLWYSFTRDNSFLQTTSSSFPGRQKKPSFITSRYINNISALMCIFSLILSSCQENQKNAIMNGLKYRSKSSFYMLLYPLFDTLFSEKYLNPQVRINQMVKKHTRVYSRSLRRHSILTRKEICLKKGSEIFQPTIQSVF